MLDQVRNTALQGQVHRFRGNHTIALDDPDTLWIVESGCFALFAVPYHNGVAEGNRRYLFTVMAGQAMLSTAAIDPSYQILAIATTEVEVTQLSLETFQLALQQGNREAIALLSAWIDQMGLALGDITPPILPQPTEGVQYFALNQGAIYQPAYNTIAWIRIQRGAANFLGFEDLSLTPDLNWFPLSSHLWVEMASPVEFAVLDMADLDDPNDWLDGVFQLQAYFLHCVGLLEEQQHRADLRRFRDRQQLNQQMMEDTLGDLASLLQPTGEKIIPPAAALNEEQALLMAAGAVGRFLGVTMQPPAKSEDLNRVADPIDAIARASRVRVRRITLEGQWWQKDCGALLAYTKDERPVALLPTPNARYEMFDPQRQRRIPLK